MDLIGDVFGTPRRDQFSALSNWEVAQRLATVYANNALLAMTTPEEAKWPASTAEVVAIARAQYISPVGLCDTEDIAKEVGERGSLNAGALLSVPLLVITTPQETGQGETAEKAAQWKELTSGGCVLESVDAPHMEVPGHSKAIELVVAALKPHVPPI